MAHRPAGICDMRYSSYTNHAVSGHHEDSNALCRALCTSRYAMAMGISAVDQRVSAQDHARELRLYREVSPLHLQLDRSQSLSPDEGVLPAGLRKGETVRRFRSMVSRGLE